MVKAGWEKWRASTKKGLHVCVLPRQQGLGLMRVYQRDGGIFEGLLDVFLSRENALGQLPVPLLDLNDNSTMSRLKFFTCSPEPLQPRIHLILIKFSIFVALSVCVNPPHHAVMLF